MHGSLDLLISATEEAQLFVTSTFQALQKDVKFAIGGAEKGLVASIGLLNEIPG